MKKRKFAYEIANMTAFLLCYLMMEVVKHAHIMENLSDLLNHLLN